MREEDSGLSISELVKKYDLSSKATGYRLLGKGFVVRDYHQKALYTDEAWANDNAPRIEEIAIRAYKGLMREYPDIFFPLNSGRDISPGVSAEDLVGEALLEIISKAGSRSFNKMSNVEETKGRITRDINQYLYAVAKNRMMEIVNIGPDYERNDGEVPLYDQDHHSD